MTPTEQDAFAFNDECSKISPHLSKSTRTAMMNDIFSKHKRGATALCEMIAKRPSPAFDAFRLEWREFKQKKRTNFFR